MPEPPVAAPHRPQPPADGFHTLDRILRAAEARFTHGLSPTAVASAWADWAIHLWRAPGKQMAFARQGASESARYWLWLLRGAALHPDPNKMWTSASRKRI